MRDEVRIWLDSGYVGATVTSKALLNWWFAADHRVEQADGSQSQFGLSAWSFTTAGLSSAIVLAVALAASLEPARRILRVDASALRLD